MNQVIKNIINKKDLEINLPKYSTSLMSLYNRFSSVRLCMNYYNFYEVMIDRDEKDKNSKDILDKVNNIIKNVIIEERTGEGLVNAVKIIDGIRNGLIKTMQTLTSYVDIFNIYEYVLNRLEHKFDKRYLPVNYKDENFTRDIMQYILNDEDNQIINYRICEILRQLPIRMAKGKFYEHISNGLTLYKGGTKSGVNDYLYMIRTSSMLDIPEDLEELYPDLYSIYESFKEANYDELTENEYNVLSDKLAYASDFMEKTSDHLILITEIVNDVYSILLSMPYALKEVDEYEDCISILKSINQKFYEDALDPLGDDITNILIRLEGKQEKISQSYADYETILEDIQKEHKDVLENIMILNQYNSLNRIQILLSTSMFGEFDKIVDDGIVDEKFINDVTNSLINDLKELFDNSQKQVNRAVMSTVLSSLPVFFENISKLQDYIYDSLVECRNIEEKFSVYELITQIMQEA